MYNNKSSKRYPITTQHIHTVCIKLRTHKWWSMKQALLDTILYETFVACVMHLHYRCTHLFVVLSPCTRFMYRYTYIHTQHEFLLRADMPSKEYSCHFGSWTIWHRIYGFHDTKLIQFLIFFWLFLFRNIAHFHIQFVICACSMFIHRVHILLWPRMAQFSISITLIVHCVFLSF